MNARTAFWLVIGGIALAVAGGYVASAGDGHHIVLYHYPLSFTIFWIGVIMIFAGAAMIYSAVAGRLRDPQVRAQLGLRP